MQRNSVLVSLYNQEKNISENHLKIFYKNSSAKRTILSRQRILRNFRVHSGEQLVMFEDMFKVVHADFLNTLQSSYPSLTAIERVLLAFLRIGLNETKICRNTGFSEEELRRTFFIIGKKMEIPVLQLRESARLI